MPVDPVRDKAVSVLLRVLEGGAHLDKALDRSLRRSKLSPRGARFMAHLVYGVVRHRLLCDHILSPLCDQPFDKLPAPVLMTLRMGVFQSLFCASVTRPAMVHTTVDLARKRGNPGLAKLVNAVLRRVPETLNDVDLPDKTLDLVEYLRVRYSMPRWMVRRWLDMFGEDKAEAFCAICNEEAPLILRPNPFVGDMDTLEARMRASGYATSRPDPDLDALQVEGSGSPTQLKSFQEGLFYIQNPASMLASLLTQPEPGDRVLDLCAAPGGKSAHLAALAHGAASIVAQDCAFGRVAAIAENIGRLRTTGVTALCADALAPPFREGSFDRVLVDAPCSGLGTLRRHPEIKWRTGPDTPAHLGVTQLAMLRKAVQLCKNGGLIVYSVCTVTQEETLDVVTALLSEGVCIAEDGPERFDSWKTAQGQYRTNPLDAAWDGFFLTRFRKRC